jgi:hypothetical protein
MYVELIAVCYYMRLRLCWVSQFGRCFHLDYRLPTVSGTFLSRIVHFRTTEYVPFVFVSGIPIFVSVWLKNMKVKTRKVFFPTVFIRFQAYPHVVFMRL